MDYSLKVPRTIDAKVFEFILGLCAAIGSTRFSLNIFGRQDSHDVDIENLSVDARSVQKSAGFLIYYANVGVNGYSFTFSRRDSEGADEYNDVLQINNRQNGRNNRINEEGFRYIDELINDTFFSGEAKSPSLFRDPEAFKQVIASHQRIVEGLEQTIAAVGSEAAKARSELEREYADRRAELEAEFDQRKAALDEAADRVREKQQLQQRDLDARTQALDDRSNTHARRELHRDLKAKIAERATKFAVTPETKNSRKPIHGTVAAVGVVLLALIYLFSAQFSESVSTASGSALVLLAIKPAGATLAFLGLMAWYLRWQNRWSERYADTEFQLKQFEMDIDRASWAVEAALEWKLSQQSPMPEHLLETISRNLFSKSEKDEDADMHPADYLASAILGRAAGVNLKIPGGGEITLNGKGIRQLQKDEA